MANASQDSYYIPHGSHWPFTGTIGLFAIMVGASIWLNGGGIGPLLFTAGFVVLFIMLFGWFGAVIRESESGMYNLDVDKSFRMGMGWFIFSEVMFFGRPVLCPRYFHSVAGRRQQQLLHQRPAVERLRRRMAFQRTGTDGRRI